MPVEVEAKAAIYKWPDQCIYLHVRTWTNYHNVSSSGLELIIIFVVVAPPGGGGGGGEVQRGGAAGAH